jgi:hypothetical protein
LSREGVNTTFLGHIAFLRGDFETAKELGKSVLGDFTQSAYPVSKLFALTILGLVACVEEDYDHARQLCEDVLLMAPVPSRHTFLVDWTLSLVACGLGDITTAIRANRDALTTAYHNREKGRMLWCLPTSAYIATHKDDTKRAVYLLSLAFSHPNSATGWIEKWPLLTQLRQALKTKLGEEAYNTAWEQGKSLDLDTVVQELLVEIGQE